MTMLFWLGAAALLALALGMLMPALLRRADTSAAADAASQPGLAVLQEQMAGLERALSEGRLDHAAGRRARDELAQRVLREVADAPPVSAVSQGPAARWVVALGLPVFAVATYAALGEPEGLVPAQAPEIAIQEPSEVTAQDIAEMVDMLARRMVDRPDDAAGWTMLGRSYAVLQQFDDASAAYARAVTLVNDDAQLLADYADVLAMSQGQDLRGEPQRLVEQALRLDPDNLKALALAGSAAFAQGDRQGARTHWDRAHRLAPAGSAFSNDMQRRLDELPPGGPGGTR